MCFIHSKVDFFGGIWRITCGVPTARMLMLVGVYIGVYIPKDYGG